MTEFELRTLIYEQIQVASGDFEFWITASFAVLVAGFYAFKNLEPNLQKTVRLLYLATASVFILRWFASFYTMYEYQTVLSEQGADLGLQIGSGIATLIQTLLMLFGTFAVWSFLKKEGSENTPNNT
jgi:hypothetical protein